MLGKTADLSISALSESLSVDPVGLEYQVQRLCILKNYDTGTLSLLKTVAVVGIQQTRIPAVSSTILINTLAHSWSFSFPVSKITIVRGSCNKGAANLPIHRPETWELVSLEADLSNSFYKLRKE